MALEPITRQEKIIAGQDLTPITRMEMFLKQYGGGGGGGGSADAVLYTAQTLTDSQKKQARDNVGAASIDFVINATLDDNYNCTVDKTYAQVQEAVQAGKKPVVYFDPGGATITMPLVASGGFFGFAGSIMEMPPMSTQYVISIQSNNEIVFDMAYGLGLGSDETLQQISMSEDPVQAMEIATKKYVDDNKCILESTTPGSTKKFKITVDDSGAISATEVTA